MEAANQSANFELETHWRLLIMGGGAGAGMFLHSDTLRTSSWQMQILCRNVSAHSSSQPLPSLSHEVSSPPTDGSSVSLALVV